MNKIQIIYTTETEGQLVANLPYSPEIMTTKRRFLIFCVAAVFGNYCFLPADWKQNLLTNPIAIPEDIPQLPALCKLSCYIIPSEGVTPYIPEWYHQCNGKIYREELKEIQELLVS